MSTIQDNIRRLDQYEHYDGPWKNTYDYTAYTVKSDILEEAEAEYFWHNFRGQIVDGGLEEFFDCQAEFSNP